MAAYLLTWNSDDWPKSPAEIATRDKLIAATAVGTTALEDWNTGRIKQVKERSRVFLVATGPHKGVVGSGVVTKELGDQPRFNDPTEMVNTIRVSWDVFLDPSDAMPMSIDDWHAFGVNPPFLQSGQNYVKDVDRLELRWNAYLESVGFATVHRGLAHQPDALLRCRVEQAAVAMTRAYFEAQHYVVRSYERDNVGWDLVATKGPEALRLEVKGLSGSYICVELTPNEYAKMQQWRDTYLVCVVTDALTAPELAVFGYRDGIWQDDKQRILHIEPVIAARCTFAS